MVIQKCQSARRRGALIFEVVMAMTILVVAMLPLAFAMNSDAKLLRISYQRAVAMEIIDGEIEILSAGGWRDVPEGTHPFIVHAGAAANLPPGPFLLTHTAQHFRLEWSPEKKSGVGKIAREVTIK